MIQTIQLLSGLALLVLGAEFLVRYSVGFAARIRVPSLVVGCTIVAFGTSAPELAISASAALDGDAAIAFGNAVGSNIFNVLGILGIAALLTPMRLGKALGRVDVPLVIAVSVLCLVLALDGGLGIADGVLLLGILAGYAAYQAYRGKSSRVDPAVCAPQAGLPAWRSLLLIVLSLIVLVLGAQLFLRGAVTMAQVLGVSELLIGLTVVAIATSLPEAATSIVAAIRGERDIAVGNIVGSNLFNLTGVLGTAAVLAPAGIAVPTSSLWMELPLAIAVGVLCLPFLYPARSIGRVAGACFVALYVGYTAALYLQQSGGLTQ